MSDQENIDDEEQQPIFTQSQMEELVEHITRKVRTEQIQESELRAKGTLLPAAIVEELDHYSETDNLSKAIQKYKKEIPKYINEDWVTAETTNPNFIDKLKEHKLDSLQHINTIYKLTETTQVQARAATEIYDKLEFLNNRGLESGDETTIKNALQSIRKLAVYGFGAAKLHESEARETTLKAIKLPPTLKHLQPQQSSGEKKHAFGDDFLEQYYNETFKQQITSQSTNHRGGYTKGFGSHGYRGRGGYNSNNSRPRPFRGRGRGTWSQPQKNRSFAPQTNNSPNDNNQ